MDGVDLAHGRHCNEWADRPGMPAPRANSLEAHSCPTPLMRGRRSDVRSTRSSSTKLALAKLKIMQLAYILLLNNAFAFAPQKAAARALTEPFNQPPGHAPCHARMLTLSPRSATE